MATTGPMPTPEKFFDMAFAFERTAAINAAVDLDVFTAIGEGAETVDALSKRCAASERGMRILCDFLTINGLLTKNGDRYQLTPDSAAFLAKSSPAYLGGTLKFLTSRDVVRNFDKLTDTIRRGSVSLEDSTVAGVEQDLWVNFAKAMVPMMMPAALGIAGALQIKSSGPLRVLDIAAGHGMFGIVLAQQNPGVEVVAVDWPGVLAVASENARKAGVHDRHRTLAGDAFKVDYGSGYDIALLTNFLHHFDVATCTALLRKVATALNPGGRVVILEFVPNEDRVSPPIRAGFSLMMLAGTPAGALAHNTGTWHLARCTGTLHVARCTLHVGWRCRPCHFEPGGTSGVVRPVCAVSRRTGVPPQHSRGEPCPIHLRKTPLVAANFLACALRSSSHMPRIQDAILSAGGLALLVAGLAAINSDARRHIAQVIVGDTRELAIAVAPIHRAARIAVATLNDYQTDNGALFAFGVAAVLLFGLLFKS